MQQASHSLRSRGSSGSTATALQHAPVPHRPPHRPPNTPPAGPQQAPPGPQPRLTCTRRCSSSTMRGSSSTAITFLARSSSFMVRLPVPAAAAGGCRGGGWRSHGPRPKLRRRQGQSGGHTSTQVETASISACSHSRMHSRAGGIQGGRPQPPLPPCAARRRAWANLQHHIRALHARLVHNRLHHQRVLQDVLALGLVELDACGASPAVRRGARRGKQERQQRRRPRHGMRRCRRRRRGGGRGGESSPQRRVPRCGGRRDTAAAHLRSPPPWPWPTSSPRRPRRAAPTCWQLDWRKQAGGSWGRAAATLLCAARWRRAGSLGDGRNAREGRKLYEALLQRPMHASAAEAVAAWRRLTVGGTQGRGRRSVVPYRPAQQNLDSRQQQGR